MRVYKCTYAHVHVRVCAHVCVCPCVFAHVRADPPEAVEPDVGSVGGGTPAAQSRAPGLPTGRRLGRWFNGFGSQRRIHYSGRSSAPW